MMQILKRLLTDTCSWFSSLCPVVFSDGLFGDEAVKQESPALFLIHRNPEHFGRELKHVFFHSLTLAECHHDSMEGGRTMN